MPPKLHPAPSQGPIFSPKSLKESPELTEQNCLGWGSLAAAHFYFPHHTIVMVPHCSGQTQPGPPHQGPDRSAFFKACDLQRMRIESFFFKSLQLGV